MEYPIKNKASRGLLENVVDKVLQYSINAPKDFMFEDAYMLDFSDVKKHILELEDVITKSSPVYDAVFKNLVKRLGKQLNVYKWTFIDGRQNKNVKEDVAVLQIFKCDGKNIGADYQVIPRMRN